MEEAWLDLTDISAVAYVHVLAIDRQTIGHAQGHTCCITISIASTCQPSVECIVSMDPYLPQHCFTGKWCGVPSSFSTCDAIWTCSGVEPPEKDKSFFCKIKP